MKCFQFNRNVKISLLLFLLMGINQPSQAAIPIAEIIRQAVVKIIVAVDLQIQRMQNDTIGLQQVQQKIENVLSESRLEEISSWSQRQKELYGEYYEGLWKVKNVLSQYQRIRDISETQAEMLRAYQKTWNLLISSGQFSMEELNLIQSRYGAILQSSVQNMGQLTELIKSFSFQISDGERLERIHLLDRDMNKNFRDILGMNLQLESLNRQRTAWLKEGNNLQNLLK
jgi:ElaB/YqjD/DUF883 family membrane-anchored ribosome-binding protein